jgi:ferredoxin-thioredoxin reductase catalytic subunit
VNPEEFKNQISALCNGKDFQLNPDATQVDFLIESIFKIEAKKGLKYCPCRLPDRAKKYDVDLLCPCNFFIQKTWQEQGRCWCGLFVKRK